jgi:hypothetical protein
VGRVVFTKEIVDQLFQIIDVLFDEDYFDYIENAQKYVKHLTEFIEQNALKQTHYTTQKSLPISANIISPIKPIIEPLGIYS